ncbi:MAG: vitamin K epoxide reductase family protein [Capsulimonadaceae bacterium]|nr:vitamin K epoxide reductase family protein [Capsulimonadaceae bacterium]
MTYRPATSLIQGLLAFAGFCDAGFVYVEKTRSGDVPCINGSTDCTTVTMGPYGYVDFNFWIGSLHVHPSLDLSQVGIAAYVVFAFLAIVKGTAANERLAAASRWLFFALALFGVCYSWYLQWLAHYTIHAFCIYCRISACIMTLLFALSAYELFASARKLSVSAPPGDIDPSI